MIPEITLLKKSNRSVVLAQKGAARKLPREPRVTNNALSQTDRFPAPHFTETLKSDYSLSMRTLFVIPLVLMSLVSLPSWGLTMDDLVMRAGLYYKKFTAVPFSGEVEGQFNGSFNDGKKEGAWEAYWENGQLYYKGSFKNGKEEGSWVIHHSNGLLREKGVYENGKKEGFWEWFLNDGSVWKNETGTFKKGLKVSD